MSTAISPAGAVVYVRRPRLVTVSAYGRVIALGLAGVCLALLVVAAGLSPSAGGFGTHRQLGMDECGFLAKTGLPCPACGMTTSFAWFVKGNLLASLYVQPMGLALAILCCWGLWTGGYVAITGRPVYRILKIIPEKIYLFPLLALAILGWGWKMFIHVHGIDGWK